MNETHEDIIKLKKLDQNIEKTFYQTPPPQQDLLISNRLVHCALTVMHRILFFKVNPLKNV